MKKHINKSYTWEGVDQVWFQVKIHYQRHDHETGDMYLPTHLYFQTFLKVGNNYIEIGSSEHREDNMMHIINFVDNKIKENKIKENV